MATKKIQVVQTKRVVMEYEVPEEMETRRNLFWHSLKKLEEEKGIKIEPKILDEKNMDVIFPIGNNFTMDVEDAIMAADFVGCEKILGCHYDTFGFIMINHDEAKKKFFDAGKDLMLLDIGESISL
jgi:hypothetical protein